MAQRMTKGTHQQRSSGKLQTGFRIPATTGKMSGILGVGGGWLLVAGAFADPPPNYYASTAGLTGAALRAELHRIVKTPHVPQNYSATRGSLEICDQDPANANNVLLIYSPRSEPKVNFVRSPPQNATEWNREHLWPNSRGIIDNGADYSDLFNLRPADVDVNSDRGNLPFEESDTSGLVVPTSPEAPLTSMDSNSWEPPPAVKGDIARSMFYMALRYDADGPQEADLILTDNMSLITGNAPYMGRLTTLLLWHLEDPVSPAEMLRNDCVETKQGNRNPFIDGPEWVREIYGHPLYLTGTGAPGQVTLTWWAGLENAVPETSTSLSSSSWSIVQGTPAVEGNFKVLTAPATGPRRFYRIRYRGIVSP
jgi:endonuclease I